MASNLRKNDGAGASPAKFVDLPFMGWARWPGSEIHGQRKGQLPLTKMTMHIESTSFRREQLQRHLTAAMFHCAAW